MSKCRLSAEAYREIERVVARGDAITASKARDLCERIVFADRNRRSAISRVESSVAKSCSTASSAALGSSSISPLDA